MHSVVRLAVGCGAVQRGADGQSRHVAGAGHPGSPVRRVRRWVRVPPPRRGTWAAKSTTEDQAQSTTVLAGDLRFSRQRYANASFTKHRKPRVHWFIAHFLRVTLNNASDYRTSGLYRTPNHWLHHLLPSERDTGHDLRRRGHSYQLVCYNFTSTRRCFVIRMLYDSL